MDDGLIGIIVLLLMSVVISLFWHYKVKSQQKANIGSTITTVLLFQIVAYLLNGYLDPFFIIAMVISAAIALFVSLIVGSILSDIKNKGKAQ